MTFAGAGNRRNRGRFNVTTLLVVLVGIPLVALALMLHVGGRRQRTRLQQVVDELSGVAVAPGARVASAAARHRPGKHAA
jgi:predicted membrane protein